MNLYQTLRPEPRFADTQELDLLDLLSTEAQDAHETEQLAYLRAWAAETLDVGQEGR